jgi:hypothetical protein
MTFRSRPTKVFSRLPSLRAAVGAGLVLAAAAGVLSAHANATRPPSTRYTVARTDLPAGHKIAAGDLGVVAVDLPRGARSVPAASAEQLVGRTTAVPLRRLDLLRPADLAPKDGSGGPGVVVPLDVETARAPGAALRPGSVVTVLATDPDSTGTVTVAPAATVVAVDTADESLGTSTTRHVRLRVATPAAAAGLVDAAVRSTITLTVPSVISDGSQG